MHRGGDADGLAVSVPLLRWLHACREAGLLSVSRIGVFVCLFVFHQQIYYGKAIELKYGCTAGEFRMMYEFRSSSQAHSILPTLDSWQCGVSIFRNKQTRCMAIL